MGEPNRLRRRPTIMSGVIYDLACRDGTRLSVGREGVSIEGTWDAGSLDRIAGTLAHLSSELRWGRNPGIGWVADTLRLHGWALEVEP